MIFVDTIDELNYYDRSPYDYCYCDYIVRPNDLTLQGQLPASAPATGLSLNVFIYSVDGTTQYGDVTAAFDWFIAKQNGITYFALRLKYIPALICAHPCFILRVKVSTQKVIFDKYTEQYCLHSCCMLPDGVTITGDGVTQDEGIGALPDTIEDATGCYPMMRMEVVFDCYDNFTGDFWNTPGDVIAGQSFNYSKVLNLRGTVKRIPREMKITISQNCKVQKSESVRKYVAQSYEQLPLWKMDEIESMLAAKVIIFDGRQYRFPGGIVFTDLYPKSRRAYRYYRMDLPLQDCTQYNIYGCGPCPTGINKLYYGLRTASKAYYSENGIMVADNYDTFKEWLRVQSGVTGVDELTPDTAITYYKVLSVEGSGYLPSYFYAGDKSAASKVYGKRLDESTPDFNSLFGVTSDYVECLKPVFEAIDLEYLICPVPDLGLPVIEYI